MFRKAYDALAARGERRADREHLRILHMAATTVESDVEAAVGKLLDTGTLIDANQVKALVAPASPEVPPLAVPTVDRSEYDLLLGDEEVALLARQDRLRCGCER